MDRDLALKLIEVLTDIKEDLDDIVTNTTPTTPEDAGGGETDHYNRKKRRLFQWVLTLSVSSNAARS